MIIFDHAGSSEIGIGIGSWCLYPCFVFLLPNVGAGGLATCLPCTLCFGSILPAAAAPVNDFLCYICFCLKSARLLHDGRNVIQLRGKAVLVLSQIPFPLLCCSVVGHGAPHVQPHILLIQNRERLFLSIDRFTFAIAQMLSPHTNNFPCSQMAFSIVNS